MKTKRTELCCLTIFCMLSIVPPGTAQSPFLHHDYNIAQVLETEGTDNTPPEIIYLKSLYQRYREYVVFNDAPYKGLTFQLEGPLADTWLWSEASFGVGAFTWDFKDGAGRKVGGILFDHPVYLGWDFQLYNNLCLSAGTTLLESRWSRDDSRKTILVNSFIGLSGKFNLNK